MTYQEYKLSKAQGKPAEQPTQPAKFTLEDYIKARRACEVFEMNNHILHELTADDYDLFEKNFTEAMSSLEYKDDEEGFDQNELEKTSIMMDAIGWGWAGLNGGTPNAREIAALAREHFENALNDGRPHTYISSGGVTVEVDIVDHRVKITFEAFEADAYDGQFESDNKD